MKRNFNEKLTHYSTSIDKNLLCNPESASKKESFYGMKYANQLVLSID